MAHATVERIAVVGGGTAGYFSALALQRWFPGASITVIESSTIPIIGVGEATTPPLVGFLHGVLGIDVHELYREVAPTWKLGIHFDWGPPGGFNYAFGWGDLTDAEAHDGSIERASLGSMLMSAKRGPIVRGPDGPRSLMPLVRFAYHLDNKRFVRFLKKCADRAGIAYVDAQIANATTRTTPAGDREIDELVTSDGHKLRFDFYVDCTGFRSLLLEKLLGSPFQSYADSLYCDRAVVADVPHDGTVKPYTLAETMDAGWCWNIPMRDVDHRGYVYSSAFISDEDAAAEMRRKNPTMSDTWSVKFRSGRHADFWSGNVVAIGNAYGFVEPLESTALHMVIVEITRLLRLLDADRPAAERERPEINRTIGAHWDYLRWFLALHYRFNKRLDTPFWRHCRDNVNIGDLAATVEDFQRNGPLSSRAYTPPPDAIFGAGGIDIMLLGQQVPTRATAKIDAPTWERRCAERAAVVEEALPLAGAFAALERHPELLDELLRGDTWVTELAKQITG